MRQLKFLLVGDKFRCGYVIMHYDLIPPENKEEIKGGGYFYLNEDKKVIELFGKSGDYGYPRDLQTYNPDQIREAVREVYNDFDYNLSDLSDYKIIWTNRDNKEVEL